MPEGLPRREDPSDPSGDPRPTGPDVGSRNGRATAPNQDLPKFVSAGERAACGNRTHDLCITSPVRRAGRRWGAARVLLVGHGSMADLDGGSWLSRGT